MFGCRLWGKFAAFRDPFTITQNLTLPIPPKTTVGGILAAILGVNYEDYFRDADFFNFKYSLVLPNPIRKKSFAQNYIMDYTKESATKLNIMKSYFDTKEKLRKLFFEKHGFLSKEKLTRIEEKEFLNIGEKIAKAQNNLHEKYDKYVKIMQEAYIKKTKPIFRELVIDPEYLIFIMDFKYEKNITEHMKKHYSEYNIYLGNTEFAANYQYIPCEFEQKLLDKLNSFTLQPDKIKFEPGKKYTNVYAATKVVENREYRDYRKLTLCDKDILLKSQIDGYALKTVDMNYNCEFI